MIIIETKAGPMFVNDQTIESLVFNAEEGVVYAAPINGIMGQRMPFAHDVERVRYVNQTQPENYVWNYSLLEEARNYNTTLRSYVFTLMEMYPDIFAEIEDRVTLKRKSDEEEKANVGTV